MRVKLAGSLVDGGLAFLLAELAALPRAAVVVEDRYSRLFKLEHVPAKLRGRPARRGPGPLPRVPIVFLETRPLADEWTFRFLGAAIAYTRTDPAAIAATSNQPPAKPEVLLLRARPH